MADKPLEWLGSSKEDLMDLPVEVQRKAGFELRSIQQGDIASDFKPMPVVGKGVEEIRIRTQDAYRVFYIAKFEGAIYVLHVFQKKTQKTSQKDIEQGQQRYQNLLQQRREQP